MIKKPYKKSIVKLKKALKNQKNCIEEFSQTQSEIARACSQNLIHKNKRNRLISRLNKKVNQNLNFELN